MTIEITTAHNEARLQGTMNFLDSGPGNAAIRIYGGARPASVNDGPTSAMLVQIELTKPCGNIANGSLNLTQLANGLIQLTGTATWARVVNGDGATAFDCDAGQGAGAWEVQLASSVLYAGGDAKLLSTAIG